MQLKVKVNAIKSKGKLLPSGVTERIVVVCLNAIFTGRGTEKERERSCSLYAD